MTEQEWDELKDRELDDSLSALFKSTGAPEPPAGFASRAMKAVRVAPLPAGRRRLGHSLTAPAGWTVLIGGAIGSVYALVAGRTVVAEVFAAFVATATRAGVGLVRLVAPATDLADIFTATGTAVARAVATPNVSISLFLMASLGALALAALNRLLFSESEATSWQELS